MNANSNADLALVSHEDHKKTKEELQEALEDLDARDESMMAVANECEQLRTDLERLEAEVARVNAGGDPSDRVQRRALSSSTATRLLSSFSVSTRSIQ